MGEKRNLGKQGMQKKNKRKKAQKMKVRFMRERNSRQESFLSQLLVTVFMSDIEEHVKVWK